MSLINLLLTIYFWTVSAIAVLITYVTLLILYPFISQKSFSRTFEIIIGYIILNAMIIPGFWRLKIKDYRQNKSWKNSRYIIVANHVSFIDTLVMTMIPLKKKYMFGLKFSQIPIFGWLCLSSGYITVDMNDISTTTDAVLRAVKSLKDGSSFMIYPEGKRSKDGKLLEFKTGAYRISQKTSIPILPICLRNTNKGMKLGAIVGFAEIEIIIGESFHVKQGWENINKSIDKTRQFILNNKLEKRWVGDNMHIID